MDNCIRFIPGSNSKSELFPVLLRIAENNIDVKEGNVDAEIIANQYYAQFTSEDFMEDFGDWINNPETILSNKLNDVNEPNLFKENNKYYYLDKYNEKIYFPLELNGLSLYFTNDEINQITERLSYEYIKNNFKLDYNNLSFENINSSSFTSKVTDLLNEKITLLEEVDPELSEYIEESLEYIEEWSDKIKSFFKTIGLNVREESVEEIELKDEEETRENFSRVSFETSKKSSVTNNVKLRLSLLEHPTETDLVFGLPKFVSFNEVYSTLLQELSTLTYTDKYLFDEYVDKIKELSNKKPYLNNLVKILEDGYLDDNLKNEFVQAFYQDKINLLSTEIDEQGIFVTKNISDVNSKDKIILNEWGNNFKDNFINNGVLNKPLIDNKIKTLNSFNKNVSSKKYNNIVDLIPAINSFKTELKSLGVNISDRGFDLYLNDFEKNNEYDVNTFKSNLVNSVSRSITMLNDLAKDNLKYKSNNDYLNPLKSQSIFTDIAKAEAFFNTETSDFSIFSNNKTYYTYSYPSYLSSKVLSWKKDRNILLNEYNSSEYNKSSVFMSYLLAEDVETDKEKISKERLDNFELGVFNSLQKQNDVESGVDNKQMSINDNKADIANKILAFIVGKKSYYPTPTPADKTTNYQYHIGYNINANAELINGRIVVNDNVLEIFYKYFEGEWSRINKVQKELKEGNKKEFRVHSHTKGKNGLKSQLFPSLSLSFDNDGKAIIPKLEGFRLYDLEGNTFDESLESVKPQIKNHISTILSNNIKSNTESMIESTLFRVENGEIINNGISNDIWNKYSNLSSNPSLQISADLYINGLISSIEYSKMFSGDAAYYKNMVDYKKRIPATYTDGLQLILNDSDPKSYKVSIIEGVEITSPYINELAKYLPKDVLEYYKNDINSTDAQAWITPNRWKFLLEKLGLWNNLYQSVYDKMSDPNAVYTEKELKKVAQPLKGVYFEINDNVPVYLKYSQAVLIPNLIKGTELQKLYDKAIKSNIDEVITIDGIKVGPIIPNKVHNDNGSLLEEFELNTLDLKNSGWKLQQNLPTKTFKDTAVGSQIQKNIFEGLYGKLDQDFELNGEIVNGQQVFDNIVNAITNLSDLGKESLKNELGIDKDGKITKPESFYNALIEELEARGGEGNIINALKTGTSPFGIPQAQQKLMNIFFSIITSRIVKVKTNGGSFIQLSNFGIDRASAEDANVIWLGEPKPLAPYQLKDGKVKPAQILLSGSFISKYIPDYKKYNSEELKEIIDSRILENVIGYRIPNQGLSSNDALEIVGILPEEIGDTVVAYTEIPTKTGSDFDIDKMYLMIPYYKENNGKLEYVESTDKTKEGYANKLIENYKAVLTNPNNLEALMTPIDFDYVKKDILDLTSSNTKEEDLFHYDVLKDVNLKHEFIAGKAGLGQVINHLVDHIRGLFHDSKINGFNIGWGNSKDNETILDLKESEKVNGTKFPISNTLSAITNGFVDIAKDPYITRGNWNTLTTDVGALLLRGGVHPFKVNAFLAQPILKEYSRFTKEIESKINKININTTTAFRISKVAESFSNETITVDDVTLNKSYIYKELVKSDNFNITYDKVKDLLKGDSSEINSFISKAKSLHENIFEDKSVDVSKMTLEDLRKQIKSPNNNKQLDIFNKFLEWQNIAKELNKNIKASKIDVNGPGKNVSSLIISENIVDELLEETEVTGKFNGYEDKMTDTILGSYFDNSIVWTRQLVQANPKLFFTAQQSVIDTFNTISNISKNTKLLDNNLADKLEKDYYSYLLGGFKPLQVDNAKNFLNNLTNKLKAAKNDKSIDNFLINNLEIKKDMLMSFVGINNKKKDNSYKSNMTNSWFELLFDENYSKLAEDLIKASFITSGFKPTLNSFYDFIPYQWFNNNKINSYIIKKSSELNGVDNNFIDQFYKNNYDNSSIVPKIFSNQFNFVNGSKGLILKTKDSEGDFPEFYSYTVETEEGDVITNLFKKGPMLVSEANKGKHLYYKVNKLGYQSNAGKIIEYSNNKEYNNSEFNDKINNDFINDYLAKVNDAIYKELNSSDNIKIELTDETIKGYPMIPKPKDKC